MSFMTPSPVCSKASKNVLNKFEAISNHIVNMSIYLCAVIYLRKSLEAVFDIGRHILAKTYGFREIEYKAIARELGNRGVISEGLSEVLIQMAGYRNRMVHFYI